MSDFAKRELASDQPLGGQLKAVRLTAELSLDQVAAITKIRKQFLSALENGNYGKFPAEVYSRGFLENYAEFLGFPKDEVMLQYRRERGVSDDGDARPKPSPLPVSKTRASRLSVTPRTLWAAIGLLSLLVAVGYLVAQLSGFASPPKLVVNKPAQSAMLASETVEVSGQTDSGAEVTINAQPIPTDPGGGFKEQVRLPAGASTVRISAKNKRGGERVITRSVVVQVAQTSPVPTPVPVATPTLTMTLHIGPNSAYVTVVVDGNTAFQGLLSPNTDQTFVASARILLTTGNAGSTKVSINGQDQGVLGREGQLRKGLEFLASTPPAAPAPAAPSPAASAKP